MTSRECDHTAGTSWRRSSLNFQTFRASPVAAAPRTRDPPMTATANSRDEERKGRGRMIPAKFEYHKPASLQEAVALLAQLGEEARPLAGGHSLIPVMKTRLSAPEHLIDLAGISGLKGIRQESDQIVIGAMTTQHEMIGSSLLTETLPIIRETSLLIADPQIRLCRHAWRQCRQRRSGQ